MPAIIYLDNQATTRCDSRVLERMLPYFTEHYGNAASKTHRLGWMAEAAVDLAREQVATSIGGLAGEVVFCSGATEANNLALRGVADAYAARGKHLVVAATEHASVLDCAQDLEKRGWQLTIVPVDSNGMVSAAALVSALRDTTVLVSLMLVNNEIGVIQDIKMLAEQVHQRDSRILFHCDAVQALGKIPIDVGGLGVDLLTLSAHKAYGPKGVGALWRRRRPHLALTPQIVGGGHERGLRGGSLPVPLVVGFGIACELATQSLGAESKRLARLQDQLLRGLQEQLGGVLVNGYVDSRVAGNLNIAIEGVSAETLLREVPGVAMSTGSACSSEQAKASHVLAAIVSPERARTSIRMGLGRFTTEQEVESALAQVISAVQRLRGA